MDSVIMASSAIFFTPNRFSNTQSLLGSSVNPFVVTKISTLSSSLSNNTLQFKLNQTPKASEFDRISIESNDEDAKFVPLNADDPVYGPPALLLLGFEVEEAVQIRELLKEMDGEFLEVIFCTEDMISRSLWEAMSTKQTNTEAVKVAKSVPRICFLSGLSGEEMMMFIDAFPESGLEPAVFAALVPNSADKPVHELIEEIMSDHEMLTAKESSST